MTNGVLSEMFQLQCIW